jgi:beta-galactosidase
MTAAERGSVAHAEVPLANLGNRTYETIENQTVQPGWSNGDRLYLCYGGYGYSWFQSNCGDIDLIGQRKPQNYWRAAVYGFQPGRGACRAPGATRDRAGRGLVGLPRRAGKLDVGCRPGAADDGARLHAGDSVRLLLNGAEVPGGAITPSNCVATFAVPYALGELAAVANGNPHNLDSFRQLDCERQRSPCLLLLLRVYGELDCLVLWQCLLLAPAFCTGLSALVIGGGVFEI